MPALPPPSMVIGAPMPGMAAGAVVGSPVTNPNAMPAAATIIQQSGTSTAVSGPTNISQTVTATKVGTTLVWAVAVSASAASALGGTPTGWTLITSQSVATMSFALYALPNNPGAITTVTFSSNATATNGGIAAWFWEISTPLAVLQSGSANANSVNLAAGSITPTRENLICLGAGAWVLGAATSSDASTPASTFALNAQQSSTNGATNNAALRTASVLNTPAGTAFNYALTLTAGSVWCAGELFVPSLASGQIVQDAAHARPMDQGAGYSSAALGTQGWSVGGSKPGGNGGGQ